jgi:hypothetical protein
VLTSYLGDLVCLIYFNIIRLTFNQSSATVIQREETLLRSRGKKNYLIWTDRRKVEL